MSEQHHVPSAIERTLEDLQAMHLTPPLAERFVGFWKRHGARKAIVLMIAVTLPLWRYVWIPHAISTGLSTLAESYGAELEVEDWSSDWGNVRMIGEDVVLQARGAYTNQHLLEANAIELDWSLWRAAGNLYDRWKALVLFRDLPPEEPVQAIKLRRATLHMERLLSGRWNWEDVVEADRVDWKALSLFRIPALDAEQLRLVWVEHLPANSGGGLVEQTTASMFLDDVRLRFTDLMLPLDARGNAASFTLEGRTGDGRFSVTGAMNLARWSAAQTHFVNLSTNPAVRAVAWAPTFDVSMYLENVGAAAITRITSDASLLPASGTMTGKIQLVASEEGVLNCKIDLQLRNVQYAPNPRSRYIQAKLTEVEQALNGLVINNHITKDCSAKWYEPEFRFAKALQAEITGEALQKTPPVIQAAAGYDRLRFVKGDQMALDRFTSDMTAKIGEAIGGERGAAIVKALTAPQTEAGSNGGNGSNPVARGARSVGRGIKRLFGGDKKKK